MDEQLTRPELAPFLPEPDPPSPSPAKSLKGDLDSAARWTEDGRLRLAKSADDRVYHGTLLAIAETIVALRKGDSIAAIARMDRSHLIARFKLAGTWLSALEVLRAFAEASGGVRASGLVSEHLLRVTPVIGKELEFLGVSWPEMQQFLGIRNDEVATELVGAGISVLQDRCLMLDCKRLVGAP